MIETVLPNAGKSTLINALLGETVLPSNNVPETARITAVRHTPAADGAPPRLTYPSSDGGSPLVVVEGAEAIREVKPTRTPCAS